MSNQLPAPAQRFIDATNSENLEELLDTFTPDGFVKDFGRVFTGRDEIKRWSDAEHIGTHNRITVTSVTNHGDHAVARISVSGEGYNGPGSFDFTVTGDELRSLVISG